MLRVQTFKRNQSKKCEAFVAIRRKMGALLIFSKICHKYILLGHYFPISKISDICFLSVLNMRNGHQNSSKFRSHKCSPYGKWLVENGLFIFEFSRINLAFVEGFM